MIHEELLDAINRQIIIAPPFASGGYTKFLQGLSAVVELHKPSEAWGDTHCGFCFDLAWEPSGLQMDSKQFTYPCPTIQAIEKELSA